MGLGDPLPTAEGNLLFQDTHKAGDHRHKAFSLVAMDISNLNNTVYDLASEANRHAVGADLYQLLHIFSGTMPLYRQAAEALDRRDSHRPIQHHRGRTTSSVDANDIWGALRVLAWLGPGSEDGWRAMSLLPCLLGAKEAQSAQNDKRRHYRLGPEGWQNSDLLDSILDSAHLVLAVLPEHAWFTGYGSSKTKRW